MLVQILKEEEFFYINIYLLFMKVIFVMYDNEDKLVFDDCFVN
jgi:hypothetical protein